MNETLKIIKAVKNNQEVIESTKDICLEEAVREFNDKFEPSFGVNDLNFEFEVHKFPYKGFEAATMVPGSGKNLNKDYRMIVCKVQADMNDEMNCLSAKHYISGLCDYGRYHSSHNWEMKVKQTKRGREQLWICEDCGKPKITPTGTIDFSFGCSMVPVKEADKNE